MPQEYDVRGSIWFGNIGIVRVKTEYDGYKYYMREGRGVNREEDEQYIATYGYPVYPSIINAFLSEKDG